MTCIVGLVDKGSVYIGGDSAGIAGLSITIRKDPKVFQNGPFIFGFTTSFRMGNILRYKLDPPQQTVSQNDMQYMVVSFIDDIRKCFADNGFSDGGNFLVGYKGALYNIESDFQVGVPAEPFDAVGCGSDLALGAMYASKGKKPIERITLALEAAATFNAGVSAPFLILEQQKPSKSKKSPIAKK